MCILNYCCKIEVKQGTVLSAFLKRRTFKFLFILMKSLEFDKNPP